MLAFHLPTTVDKEPETLVILQSTTIAKEPDIKLHLLFCVSQPSLDLQDQAQHQVRQLQI